MTAAIHTFTTGTAPGTPGTGKTRLYAKTDKKPYWMDDTGTETPIALGGVVGPANTVYLSIGGVDGSAVRGDASKPFGTLKAALAACQDGDCLSIGPGTYNIAVLADEPVWPAGVNHLSIIGSGNPVFGTGGTLIVNSVNDGSHIFAPVNTAKTLIIKDLCAQVTLGTGRALFCDGTGAAGDFLGGNLDGGLIISNCSLLGAVTNTTLKYVGICYIYNSLFSPGGSTITEFLTSNILEARNCTFGNVTHDHDAAAVDRPVALNVGVQLISCRVNKSYTVSTHPKVVLRDCDVGEYILGSGLTAIAGAAPSIDIIGGSVTNFDFSGARAFPDTTETKLFRLNKVKIWTGLQISVAGAAVNRLSASAHDCDILNTGSHTIVVNSGVDLDLRGTAMGADCYSLSTNGTGTVKVDRCLRAFITDGTSPDIISIDQGSVLTFTSAPDYCFVTPAGINAGIVAASPLSATQVTITYSVNAVQACQLESVWT